MLKLLFLLIKDESLAKNLSSLVYYVLLLPENELRNYCDFGLCGFRPDLTGVEFSLFIDGFLKLFSFRYLINPIFLGKY
jgi:hypothetical protein